MPASRNTPRPDSTLVIHGLSVIAERYRAFLIDQWGVLHDGVRACPGALECLARLRERGKPVVILSNSGRSGAANEKNLAKLGFPRDLYDAVLSAGDDAREAIASSDEAFYRDLGRRCLLLAREGDRDLADGLGLDVVEDPDRADFVLLMSMDPPEQSLARWRPLLQASVAAGLPMICGNPDLQRTTGDGTLQEAPGTVAQAYVTMGGIVRFHGKPEPRIYRSCLSRLGLPASAVLCVGDSLLHDIAGAKRAGMHSAFIAGGIHRQELVWRSEDEIDPRSCHVLFDRARQHPEYAAPLFRWGGAG